jgi:hypothetical protein
MKKTVLFAFTFATMAPLAGCAAPSAADSSSASAGELEAAQTSADARPAAVPPEFRITPNGYFHPSCLFEVQRGEQVAANGNIVRTDGTERAVSQCTYPHFDRAGRRVDGSATGVRTSETPVPGIGHSYLALFTETISNVTWFSADFKVPLAPYRHGGEVVYFFNGIEPSDESQIIQPVLQWNEDGKNTWAVSSWYVTNSSAYFSTPVNVTRATRSRATCIPPAIAGTS